ncbi:MAG: hypothetical protein QOG67_870 [Verrucomicrobiota bacterium]|jgi:uncharacterized protein
MKIHLNQIPHDGLHLKGEENCSIAELETEDIRCAGPLHYDLELGVSDGALWANGSLSQPVELRCVSCLERFAYTIQVPAMALHTELRGPEMIDLTPFMREDILLNLPAHPHCDREGGRVCRAATPQYSKLEEQEQEAKREHDWEALDKLNLNR